jgi:hypothetical protein
MIKSGPRSSSASMALRARFSNGVLSASGSRKPGAEHTQGAGVFGGRWNPPESFRVLYLGSCPVLPRASCAGSPLRPNA